MGVGLPRKEEVILRLLLGRTEKYGLELVAESDGELKPGTIYVTLHRMTKRGYVEAREEAKPEGAIGPPKKLYKITGLGELHYQRFSREALAKLEESLGLPNASTA